MFDELYCRAIEYELKMLQDQLSTLNQKIALEELTNNTYGFSGEMEKDFKLQARLREKVKQVEEELEEYKGWETLYVLNEGNPRSGVRVED